MTKEKAKELLPIIQAFADGRTLQVRVKDSHPHYKWENRVIDEHQNLNFEIPSWEWRIKPEPREFWLCLSSVCADRIFISEDMALEYQRKNENVEIINVKEKI